MFNIMARHWFHVFCQVWWNIWFKLNNVHDNCCTVVSAMLGRPLCKAKADWLYFLLPNRCRLASSIVIYERFKVWSCVWACWTVRISCWNQELLSRDMVVATGWFWVSWVRKPHMFRYVSMETDSLLNWAQLLPSLWGWYLLEFCCKMIAVFRPITMKHTTIIAVF